MGQIACNTMIEAHKGDSPSDKNIHLQANRDLKGLKENAEKAMADTALLRIRYAVGDGPSTATKNINLTVTGAVYGTEITWASSNISFISNKGLGRVPRNLFI